MVAQVIDFMEFRGMTKINKNDKSYTFYRFEDPEGQLYEMIGFEVENEEFLQKGNKYTVFVRIGRQGKGISLHGVQAV